MTLETAPLALPRPATIPARQHGAPELLRASEALDRAAADVAAAVEGPQSLARLSSTVAALESACRRMARASTAMALAATDARAVVPSPPSRSPAARAAAWRLHHLSRKLRETEEACQVVAAGAPAFERSLAAGDAPQGAAR
jgi:hypothetical protein